MSWARSRSVVRLADVHRHTRGQPVAARDGGEQRLVVDADGAQDGAQPTHHAAQRRRPGRRRPALPHQVGQAGTGQRAALQGQRDQDDVRAPATEPATRHAPIGTGDRGHPHHVDPHVAQGRGGAGTSACGLVAYAQRGADVGRLQSATCSSTPSTAPPTASRSFLQPGTPATAGSRRDRRRPPRARTGVRLVAVSRPGYGASPATPPGLASGRSAGCAAGRAAGSGASASGDCPGEGRSRWPRQR